MFLLRFCLGVILLLGMIWPSLWAVGLSTDDSVPAGFESLAGPRNFFVDVIFNDQLVGTTTITVEGDQLSFEEPERVMTMLDTVEAGDKLFKALTSPQATHVEQLCYRPGEPLGCGSPTPTPLAVLFDEDALKVILFVDSALQQVRADNAPRYLNTPQRRGSAIVSLAASANSFGGGPWEHDLRAEGWLGYGRGYLRSTLQFDDHVSLGSLALVHQFKDHEVLAGSYSFTAGSMLSSFDVLGLRISSSLQARLDPEHARGSELAVLLDRRALVKLLVDGRLYSTQSLEAGHVSVDTADLPDGSLVVEVRILDPVSGERTEYHRFTRSALLPPPGQNAIEFSVGVPLQREVSGALPDAHEIGVGSLRVARRLSERTALSLGFVRLGNLHLLQPEFVLLNQALSVQSSASFGVRGEYGFGLRGLWRRESLSASLSGEWFSYGSATPPPVELGRRQKHWLPRETGQLSLSLDGLHGRTSLGLYGSVRQESNALQTVNTDSVGVRVRHRLSERSKLRSSISFGLRKERDSVSASVDFRVSFANHSRTTSLLLGAEIADSSMRSQTTQHNEDINSVIGYETRWRSEQDRQWQLEGGLLATGTRSSAAISLDAGIAHRTFHAAVQSQRRNQDTVDVVTDTAVNLSTQLVIDKKGITFAGRDAVRTGFIVDVGGEPANAVYDIVVNSARSGTGRVGTPSFVALPPFAHYQIQLQPRSLLASTFEQENFQATLYPGNILRLATKARHRRLLISTVVDKSGELLSNAVLQRDQGPLLIGTNGLLQVETSEGEKFKVERADGSACEIQVPAALGDEEVVVLSEPLMCR